MYGLLEVTIKEQDYVVLFVYEVAQEKAEVVEDGPEVSQACSEIARFTPFVVTEVNMEVKP